MITSILIGMITTLSEGTTGLFVSMLAVLLMFIALIKKDEASWLMVIAALLTVPSTYMLGAWTGVLLMVRLMPLLQLISAYAISKDEMLFAWFFSIVPFALHIYVIYKYVIS